MARHLLVTGGAGFIGSNFVHRMLGGACADRVTVLDKLTYAGNLANLARWEGDARFRFVQGDIGDSGLLRRLIGAGVTHVVHFAAESHVDRSILGPEAFVRTNVLGTFTILEALREAGWGERPLGRMLLHVSTDEVFGSLGARGHFRETSPYRPNSPYSASKAGSDHLVRAYFHTYGVPAAVSNCSNNYGPYQFPEKLIPLIVLNGLAGKELPVYGTGGNVRDWLYVDDHCSGLERILERGRPGRSYAFGGLNEWSNLALVKQVCGLLDEFHRRGAPHERLIRFVKDRPGHDKRYAIDPGRASRELEWQPGHSFADGLRRTVQWYLANRDWWEGILSGEYRDYYRAQYA